MDFFAYPLSLLHPVHRDIVLAPCLHQKEKKSLSCKLAKYTNKRWWMSRCSINLPRVQNCVGLGALLATFLCSHSLSAASSVTCSCCLNFHLKLQVGNILAVIQVFNLNLRCSIYDVYQTNAFKRC